MIKSEEVKKLAELARISITSEEVEKVRKEIESILKYVSEIQTVAQIKMPAKENVPRNVIREDDNPHAGGIYTDAVLNEAPKRDGDYIKVKKILKQ